MCYGGENIIFPPLLYKFLCGEQKRALVWFKKTEIFSQRKWGRGHFTFGKARKQKFPRSPVFSGEKGFFGGRGPNETFSFGSERSEIWEAGRGKQEPCFGMKFWAGVPFWGASMNVSAGAY